MDGIGDIIRLLRESWYKKYTPVIITTITAIGFILYSPSLDFQSNKIISIANLAIILFIYFGLIITWFITYYKIPKVKDGCIGILIYLKYRDKELNDSINWSLLDKFEEYLIKSSSIFQVIRFPEHLMRKYNPNQIDSMVEVLSKTNSKLCLFGRCDYGNNGSKEVYSIELDCGVIHRPIPDDISARFSLEMKELICSKIIIPKNDEIGEFENSSKQLEIVCKYILGIASFLSGDFELSKNIFGHLSIEIKNYTKVSKTINLIRGNIKYRMYDTYSMLARVNYLNYRESLENNYLINMKHYLELMNNLSPNTYTYFLFAAVYHFLDGRQIDAARRVINSCRSMYNKSSDAAWIYSDAFLDAYEGNLKSSYTKYLIAFSKKFTDKQLFDVEIFIEDVLKIEPNKYQLHFCLGLVNFYYKKDYELAYKDFEKFLKHPNNSSIEIKQLTLKIVSELHKKMHESINKSIANG